MRLAFVGDIALGDHPKTVGFGFGSRYKDGIPAARAHRLRPPGAPPDLMMANLEFALANTTTATGVAAMQCRGAPEFARFLATTGVTALNVANNHSSQHGLAAFQSTVNALRASGLHVVGTSADFGDTGVLRIGDRRIAILGWSDRPRQYAAEQPPYNEFDESAYDRIREARQRADLVIASIHWGDEFILVPQDRERTIAKAMVDAGATCVIGHHPHVVREVERYKEAVIAYSLGNFVGDMTWDPRTRFSSWLTVDLPDEGSVHVHVTPATIDDDYFPRLLTEQERSVFTRELYAAAGAQRDRVAKSGYAAVAERERRRHVRLTAWMMLRNLRCYPRGLGIELFRSALSHRLNRVID